MKKLIHWFLNFVTLEQFCLQNQIYMICIKTDIPQEICNIDDELKAIYHSRDAVCIWVFKTRDERNKFMDETVGMKKDERDTYFAKNYG